MVAKDMVVKLSESASKPAAETKATGLENTSEKGFEGVDLVEEQIASQEVKAAHQSHLPCNMFLKLLHRQDL